ncbi:MAG TPA: ABC transporter permease [Gemmatimonadaceae bacterium]|nr:ABC transporter permease [Gemmatimonadaceae bacterium]
MSGNSGDSRLPNGVRRLFRLPRSRARMLAEMDEELRSHLALRVDHLRSLGMSERDAEAEALRRFGDSDEYGAYAAHRSDRRGRWLDILDWGGAWMQDVRFAHRQFVRSVGFTALAVLTLALGIGANTAIFTVVHRLLIAPLPYADGDRIVKLVIEEGANGTTPTGEMRAAWRASARSLETIAAVSIDALYLQDFGETRDSIPAYVTSNFLGLLGLRPALGRAFLADDERDPAVAMISYGKWQRQYGGRADVLGSVVHVGNRQYTVVGVMPSDMSIPMMQGGGISGNLRQAAPAIWIPAPLDSVGDYVFAKLRPGVTTRQASTELQTILERLPKAAREGSFMNGAGDEPRARAMRAQDFLDPRETQTVKVLFVAVAVLLLIACANVANLLMSRAWTRRREFAVRIALGAGRGRLARQVLTESVLLALAGGMLGVGVAWVTLRIIVALRPPALAHLADVRIEAPVLLWSAAVSIATGILFGCAPALFASARSVGAMLRSEGRSVSGGTAARRLRSTLIVLEIALSLVLLVGAGLLVRSFAALQRMPLGFEPRGLVAADVMLGFRRDWTDAHRAAVRNQLMERLRAIPGVTDASMGMMPGLGWRALDLLATDPDASGQSKRISEFASIFITPGYLRVAGMSLVEGRLPDSLTWPKGDAGSVPAPPTEIMVSRALARRFWPDGGAVGAHLRGGRSGGRNDFYTVVGVVDDAHMPGGRDARWTMELYVPMPPRISDLLVMLRTTLSEKEAVAAIRRVVAELDAPLKAESGRPFGALLREVTVGDRYLRDSLAPTRFAMALLAAFSAVALALSAIGLYGVIAYSVTQRTREIGVRVALGADAGSVQRLVVGGGLRLTALGVVLGLGAAAASTRVLASLLYGVSPADPVSFAGIAVLVVAIASAASYIPARRALRIDPMEALRTD